MKKTAIVINGAGGVGKDTLCELAAKHYKVRTVSSITPIKELATICGWNGEKTDKARKFLSDLKILTIDFSDYPINCLMKEYEKFLLSEDEILFVHIRESSEIAKFVQKTNGKAKTLLIRGGKRSHEGKYGNISDDDVENFSYDGYYTNDLPLSETEVAFVNFLKDFVNT